MSFIKALWRGEKSLMFTFWMMGVLGECVFQLYALSIEYHSLHDDIYDLTGIEIETYLEVAYISYSAFVLICVWRSAGYYILEASEARSKRVMWGYLARAITIVGWLKVLVLNSFTIELLFEIMWMGPEAPYTVPPPTPPL